MVSHHFRSNGKQSNTPPQVEEQEGDIDHTAGPDVSSRKTKE